MLEFLKGKKAYIVSGVMCLYGSLMYLGWIAGGTDQAINIIFGALGISSLRAGIAKT
jgi:hypothetical protein